MEKEVLLELGWFDEDNETRTIKERDLIKFFESNVCIPKGTNRHPYADVLHEIAEGATCEIQDPFSFKWVPVKSISLTDIRYPLPPHCGYRIKPQEPVYEWQWYIIINGKVYTTSHDFRDKVKEFMTEDEIINASKGYFDYKSWKKIPETKRERK